MAWLGFRVTGKVAPATVKPTPVKAAELTVTGAVPLEVKVTDFVAGVFNATLPKARVVVLTVRVGVQAFNCKAKLSETLPAVAVRVADCAEVTAETVAVNAALVALAGTVNVAWNRDCCVAAGEIDGQSASRRGRAECDGAGVCSCSRE